MKADRYSATDFVVAIVYGGLAEISNTAADVIFGLVVVAVVALFLKGYKVAYIFGDGHGEISVRTVMVRVFLLLIGLFIGHDIVRSTLAILV